MQVVDVTIKARTPLDALRAIRTSGIYLGLDDIRVIEMVRVDDDKIRVTLPVRDEVSIKILEWYDRSAARVARAEVGDLIWLRMREG